MASNELSGMQTEVFGPYAGKDLEQKNITVRISESVLSLFEESCVGMGGLPKQMVAGHALALYIAKARTAKAKKLTAARRQAIGNERSKGVSLSAPKPILDWFVRAGKRAEGGQRPLIEAALLLWHSFWIGKRQLAATKGLKKAS